MPPTFQNMLEDIGDKLDNKLEIAEFGVSKFQNRLEDVDDKLHEF